MHGQVAPRQCAHAYTDAYTHAHDCVQLLLSHGAETDFVNYEGMSALDVARNCARSEGSTPELEEIIHALKIAGGGSSPQEGDGDGFDKLLEASAGDGFESLPGAGDDDGFHSDRPHTIAGSKKHWRHRIGDPMHWAGLNLHWIFFQISLVPATTFLDAPTQLVLCVKQNHWHSHFSHKLIGE